MSCNCYYDVSPPEFYHIETLTAKKEHRCYECWCSISPGEKYERIRAKWEGEIATIKTCADCITIRVAFEKLECFCWLHGSLLDDVRNHFIESDFDPGQRFSYLRILAKHRLRKKHFHRVKKL